MRKSRLSPQKDKVRTFRSRLSEDLKDPEFKTHYQEELQVLKLAAKDYEENPLFSIGGDGFSMGRHKGSVKHDDYIYRKKS